MAFFSTRDMMKTDRLALLIVALALIVAGTVLGLKNCTGATPPATVVVVDTVRVSEKNDTIKTKKRKNKQPSDSAKIKKPVARDYYHDRIDRRLQR